MSLLLFYMEDLNDPESDTKSTDKVQFGYWTVGVLIQLYAGEQQLGSPYNREYWQHLEEKTKDSETPKQTVHIYDSIPITYATEWSMRSWMDFCVNSVARDIIMFTFPI